MSCDGAERHVKLRVWAAYDEQNTDSPLTNCRLHRIASLGAAHEGSGLRSQGHTVLAASHQFPRKCVDGRGIYHDFDASVVQSRFYNGPGHLRCQILSKERVKN